MSRAHDFHAGRLGKLNLMGSNPDLVGLIEPWSSQTNDIKIDTCHSLVWHSAGLGQGRDWMTQCQDTMTEWHDGAG